MMLTGAIAMLNERYSDLAKRHTEVEAIVEATMETKVCHTRSSAISN